MLVVLVESTRYDHRQTMQTGETYFEVTVRLRVIASFQIKDGLLFWDEGQTRLHFPVCHMTVALESTNDRSNYAGWKARSCLLNGDGTSSTARRQVTTGSGRNPLPVVT